MSALTLALPSKGRLQEQALAYLSEAGLTIAQSRGARDYAARLGGVEGVNVMLLSAAEIAGELLAGRVHLGITGEDLLREQSAEADMRVAVVDSLGFGRADVVVAVPRSWIDVATMSDLDDVAHAFHARHHRRLRVATKYVNLTRSFFGSHNIADYRIVESLGATEGAPAAGTAEIIVDITTTGATLLANNLKVLDDGLILSSQALLAAGLRATWDDAARRAASGLLDRLAAREVAKASLVVRVPLDGAIERALPQLGQALGVRLMSGKIGSEGALLVPQVNLAAGIAALRNLGVGGAISTQAVDYVFLPDNALWSGLAKRLG